MELFKSNEKGRVIFHFNKKHNEDPSIPTWVVKHKGETYYVNHLISNVGFTTKETPDNDHTKGSLMIRGLLTIFKSEDGIIAQVD